jgi:hypothetical protein
MGLLLLAHSVQISLLRLPAASRLQFPDRKHTHCWRQSLQVSGNLPKNAHAWQSYVKSTTHRPALGYVAATLTEQELSYTAVCATRLPQLAVLQSLCSSRHAMVAHRVCLHPGMACR